MSQSRGGRRRERVCLIGQTRRKYEDSGHPELSPAGVVVSTGETADPTIREGDGLTRRVTVRWPQPRPLAFTRTPSPAGRAPGVDMTTEATVVFVTVVALRFLVPLLIPGSSRCRPSSRA